MTLLEKEEFVLLSEVALAEERQEKLIDILRRRNRFLSNLFGQDHDAFSDEADECLRREDLILQKLKDERHKVLEQIQDVWKARLAAKSYAPIHPVPFGPPFTITKA
jgi:hypothetical protein